DFNSMPFTEFVSKLEQKENLRFFFMEAWVDTIVVKQQSIPITLKQLLYDTFNDTYLNYFFDGPNILITNNYPIHATLPENFFLATKEELQDITNTTEVEKEVRYAFVDPGTKKQTQGVLRFGDPKRSKGGQFTLSGVIRDANNGEAIIPYLRAVMNCYSSIWVRKTSTNPYCYMIMESSILTWKTALILSKRLL